ncbi:MAG: hypothetical protein QOF96_3366 [Actinomycetota bacterium]|nr:hypothetical protein [Actinomycetota bacterium]
MGTTLRRFEPSPGEDLCAGVVESPLLPDTLGVLGWNICRGGGDRIDRLARAMAMAGVHVVVCSEVTAKRKDELAAALWGAGFVHQADRLDPPTPGDPFAMQVASRGPLAVGDGADPETSPARFVHVVAQTDLGAVDIVGIHVPTVDPAASNFFEGVCGVLGRLNTRPAILIGDVNADARYPGLVTRFLRRITDAGWVDALGPCEPATAHDSYWGTATAYALDRVWLSPPLAMHPTECVVLPSVSGVATAGPGLRIKTGALSDHRPVRVMIHR